MNRFCSFFLVLHSHTQEVSLKPRFSQPEEKKENQLLACAARPHIFFLNGIEANDFGARMCESPYTGLLHSRTHFLLQKSFLEINRSVASTSHV